MTTADVAARLGVSRARVHQLDPELRPERCACGARRYDERTVAAYEVKREQDREALSAARRKRMLTLRAKLGL